MIIRFLALALSCWCLTSCAKTKWTKKETIDWYARCGPTVRGGLLYQGSDEQQHHFLARAMDDWVFITIDRKEVILDKICPYSPASSTAFAYYAVDPIKDFKQIDLKDQAEPTAAVSPPVDK